MHDNASEMRIPHVFLNHNNNVPDECQLVVYRVSAVTVCLFISASIELDHEFFVSLDVTLAPMIVALSADVAEQAVLRKTPSSLNTGTDSIRFLYFNQWNMAFKSTLHQSIPGHRRVLQCQSSANNDVIKVLSFKSQIVISKFNPSFFRHVPIYAKIFLHLERGKSSLKLKMMLGFWENFLIKGISM